MARINYSEPDYPMLEYEIGSFKYSFSVKDFPKESYDWLCDCIQADATKIYRLAYLEGKMDVQRGITHLLGLS